MSAAGPRSGGGPFHSLPSGIFETLLQQSSDWIYWKSPSGTITHMAAASQSVTGYPPQMFLDNPDLVTSLIHPDDREAFVAGCQKSTAQSPHQQKVRIIHRDGTIRWIDHTCQVMEQNGQVLGTLVINKPTFASVRETTTSHDDYQNLLFQQGPVIIVKWQNTTGWPVSYISPNVQDILGYPPIDFLSGRLTYESIIAPEDRQSLLKQTQKAIQEKKQFLVHKPYRVQHADGSYRWLLDYTILIRNTRREVTHFYGYVVDVTRQMAQDFQLKENFKRLRALTRTLEKLNRSQSLKDIYRIAIQGITSVLKADRASILLFEADNRAHFKSWKNLSSAYRKAVDGHSPWQPDDVDASPFWYEDVASADLEEPLKSTILNEGIRSLAFIPLKGPARLLGKFMVYYNTPHRFSTEELHYIRILSENLSSAITRQIFLEQLQQSEEKYRSIFQNVSEGIYQSTADGRFLTVNPAMVQLFGYESAEEMLAIPNTAALYWDANERKRLSALANQKGYLKNVEVKMRRKDGTPIWVLMNDRAVYDSRGKFMYFEGTLIDITDRKLTEQALKESEETYRLLIKGAPFPTAIYINETIYFCNAATLKLVEAERYDDVIGKNVFDFVHPDSKASVRQQYEAFIKGEKLPPTEEKILTLKGNTRYVFVHSVLTRFEGKEAVLVQMIDITEWKRSQQALQESEERFRLAFRTSPDALSITRLNDGVVVDVNDGFTRITGYTRDEVVGKKPEELGLWLSAEERDAFVKQLLKNGEIANQETRFRLKDGRIIHALLSARTFKLNGVPHILSIAKDIEPLKQAQKALQESEERLRILINSTPDIICFKDGQGRWQEANQADLKLFEIDHVDYRGKTDSQLAEFSPFYREAFLNCERTDDAAWRQKSISREIEIIPRPDGSRKYYDVIKVPVFNPDGSRKALVVFGRDITEQKLVEQSLQRQLHFMKALNELARSVIIHNDQDNIFEHLVKHVGEALQLGSCLLYTVDMNRKVALSTYYWRNPALEAMDPPPPACSLEGRPQIFQHLLTGHYITSTPSQPHSIIEKDNLIERLHGHFKIKSLLWYPLGRYQSQAFVLMCHHFTHEHQWETAELDFIRAIAQLMEIALMKAQFIEQIRQNANEIKQLALLVEQAKEIFAVTDLDGRIEYVNRAFEETTGFSADEVMGQTFQILKSDKESPTTFKEMWQTIRNGQEWRGRIVNRKKDGTLFIEDAVIFPIKDENGNVVKFCKIARDISHEVQLEERLRQSQKMEAIGTLAGGIAHDFNNILTPLLGYTELALLNAPKGSLLHTQLEQIYQAGQRAKDLIKQILAFSRQSTPERKPIQIVPIVKEALKLLRATIPATITIEADVQQTTSTILADPVEIHQVIMNLCTNAYQAMPHGGTLTVTLKEIEITRGMQAFHPSLTPGKYIKISVKDTGVGIPHEIKDKIFEPYFTTKQSGEGTGLGLAMVHGIVTSCGGSVTVYSEPGKGAEFCLYFPIINKTSRSRKVENQKVSGGTETILFVDDEPAIVELGKRMLETLGYRVVPFVKPAEALAAFEANPEQFDLVVTDMTMPEMTGAQLAQKIRERAPNIPIILTTGFSEKISPSQAKQMGINQFMNKPFSPNQLARTIRKLLDARNGD